MVGITVFILFVIAFNELWPVAHRFIRVWGLLMWGFLLTSMNTHILVMIWILILASLVPVVVFAIRALIAAHLIETGQGRLGPFDHLLWAIGGVLAAGTVFRWVGAVFAGATFAMGLHISVVGLAVLIAVAAIAVPSVWRTGGGACAVALLALTGLSALWFPGLIQEQAKAAAVHAEFTLTSKDELLVPSQTTYLTLPKNTWNPHAVLSFETPEGTCNLAWSYGYRSFRGDNWLVNTRACPD